MSKINQIFVLFLITLGSVFAFSSCDESNDDSSNPQDEYIIFGSYYGQCIGNCVHVFKIDNTALWKDTMAKYPGIPPYDFEKLPDSLFQKTRSLRSKIPNELQNFPEKTYGCPDCADQGGILFGIYSKESLKTWRFDNDVSKNPQELQPFINLIQTYLNGLRKD